MKKFNVYLDRCYASEAVRLKLEPCAPLAHVVATAETRAEAALKVWAEYGEKWRSLMEPRPWQLVVRLNVGQVGSVTGAASRIEGIIVSKKPFRLFTREGVSALTQPPVVTKVTP